MLSVKARDAADTIFKVFGMSQLRIKPNVLASQANALIIYMEIFTVNLSSWKMHDIILSVTGISNIKK